MTLDNLKSILLKSCDNTISHPEWQDGWIKEKPTHGCCVPIALIVRDYFGGDIYRHNVRHHWYNLVDGKFVDLSQDQFEYDFDDKYCYANGMKSEPDMTKNKTQERYESLKKRIKN
ncbi:MAG: hypothetical protein FWE53_02720 [Firmicutes bacterium]|nr:hypothetical protein [Bacillota bacterium]